MESRHRLYQDRIAVDPAVMVGKPVVKGTRVPVETVLRHLAFEPDVQTVLDAFPHLTRDDIRACLDYAQAVVAGETIIIEDASHLAVQ